MKYEVGQVVKGAAGSELNIFTAKIKSIQDHYVIIDFDMDSKPDSAPVKGHRISKSNLASMIEDFKYYTSPLYQALK